MIKLIECVDRFGAIRWKQVAIATIVGAAVIAVLTPLLTTLLAATGLPILVAAGNTLLSAVPLLLIVCPLALLLCDDSLSWQDAIQMVVKRLPMAILMILCLSLAFGALHLPAIGWQFYLSNSISVVFGDIAAGLAEIVIKLLCSVAAAAMLAFTIPAFWLHKQGPMDAVGHSIALGWRNLPVLVAMTAGGMIFINVATTILTILAALLLPDSLHGVFADVIGFPGSIFSFAILPALFWPFVDHSSGETQSAITPDAEDDGLHGRW